MYLLKDLWYGNVNPSERYVRRNSEYRKLAGEINACIDQLTAETDKPRALLEELLNKQLLLTALSEEDAFLRGVRIGAQFMLDVIGPSGSQFPLGEES